MSSSPSPSPGPDVPSQPLKLRIISHTGLIYWWPVWLVGLILGGLTYLGDQRLAVLPPGSHVKPVSKNTFELTVPGDPPAGLVKAAQTPADQDPFPTRVTRSESYGMTWAVVLVLVIFGSNVPLRGMASLVAVLLIVLVTGLLAYLDVWPSIFDYLGGLRLYMSTEAFVVPSVALLIVWLLTVFVYDRLRYMTFTPGQFVLHKDIGDLRQVYDTTQITAEKRRTDYFRHWVLGLGAGDMIITVPGQNVVIEFPNVLFIDRRLREVADLMKTKPVIPG
jgi:hypothetical protein